MADDDRIPPRVRQEAAEISRAERVASVYLLPNGRYIATSTGPHMITGRRIEVYLDGQKAT